MNNKLNKRDWGWAVLAAIIFVCVLPWILLQSAPTGWFLQYKSIELVEPAHAGGPLSMVSTVIRSTNLDLQINYNDVLRCDTDRDGQFENFSHQKSGPLSMEIERNRIMVLPWHYRGAVPLELDQRCVMESNITYRVTLWIYSIERKLGTILSNVFIISEKKIPQE